MSNTRKITIGNSHFGKVIFAGHLNKKGDQWLDKQDCTMDVLMATVMHCLKHGDQAISNADTGKVEFEISVKDLRESQTN